MTKKSRGFTLIELLVVIAIIGILAAIVLVSLGGARTKAKNARIQADMSQLRAVAELLYNDASPMAYTGMCETTANTLDQAHADYGSELGTIESDINTQNGGTLPACFASGDNYCVSAVIAGAAATPAADEYICVSSAGQVGNNACTAADTACTP